MLNSISRLGETRPKQKWSNGTEFSGHSDFPEFQANAARYNQNYGMTFWKMSVPFAPPPRISGIFCQIESTHCVMGVETPFHSSLCNLENLFTLFVLFWIHVKHLMMYTFRSYSHEVNSKFQNNCHYGCEAVESLYLYQ